ncbi:MAG: HDOD domain-containing protein [Gammaproteobacteria bacterium]|nr:HDOD domain-containing protein [Gammaproteobacteria bacterium]
MPEGIEAWIQLVVNEPLPQMRRTSEALRHLARVHDPDLVQIVDVIRQDCGCAIQLLRCVSELKSNRQVSEVCTLERAVVMLGSRRALSLADELPVVEELLSGNRLAGYMRVAAWSCHAARQAVDWARIRRDRVPEEVELAALLNGLAELVLWRFGKQEMVRLEQASWIDVFDEVGPGKGEIQVLGFGIQELGRELAKRWQLPSLVHTCLIPINALEPRALGPMFAAKLARTVQRGWYHPTALELVDMVGDYLETSPAEGAARVHATAVHTCRTVDFHGEVPVAAGLLYSGEIPQITHQPQRAVHAERSDTNTKKPQSAVQKTPIVAGATELDLAVYHRALERLDGENLGVNAVLETAMNGLHLGLALQRVLFAVITPGEGALRIRYTAGVADDPRFKGFLLPLLPPHLLTRVMEKPQALWVHKGNVDKLWRHVPQILKDLIKVKTFFMMSVFANGKPVGMFYADRAVSGGGLEQVSFMGFKSLCTLTGQALGRTKSNSKEQKKSA